MKQSLPHFLNCFFSINGRKQTKKCAEVRDYWKNKEKIQINERLRKNLKGVRGNYNKNYSPK